MKLDTIKPFGVGFLYGLLLSAAVSLLIFKGQVASLIQHSQNPPQDILAQVGEKKLTSEDTRKMMRQDLVFLENDEYVTLKKGVDAWLARELIEREAKAQGISPEELQKKEIGGHAIVTREEMENYLKNHEELKGRPLEQIGFWIGKQIRKQKYQELKSQYAEALAKKYGAQVFLSKPAVYFEGVGMEPEAFLHAAAKEGPLRMVTFSDLAGRPAQGLETAPVTIVEFSDFHCPFCKKLSPTLQKLVDQFPGKVRWVWRHYPLPFHAGSERAHQASECAHEQGEFWEFHNQFFAAEKMPDSDDALIRLAEKTTLDKPRFQACFEKGKYSELVKKEIAKGAEVGVEGTPATFLNGKLLSGAQPYENFEKAVQDELMALEPAPKKP